MLAAKYPELEKAYNELRVLSQDKETRKEYESRIKAKRDEISRLEGAYTEGEKKAKLRAK